MAAKARILYNADALAVSGVTSSSDGSGKRDDNVLHDHPGKIWQADGDVGEWVKFYNAAGISMSQLFIGNHNLSSTASITLQGNATNSWGSPSFSEAVPIVTDADSVVIPRCNHFFTSVSYAYWRIFINDANNPNGKIRIGRVYGGDYYELTRNFSDGARFTWKDPSIFTNVPGSVENLSIKEGSEGQASRFRQLRVDFRVTNETEFEKWEAIFSKIGNSRPCILSLDPDNEPVKKAAYCYLLTDMDIVWNLSDNYDVLTLVFEEKTR